MSVMRSVLLAVSENRWMRQKGPRLPFVRRAVRRFMPGETVEDALRAAEELRRLGMATVFTKLGENVTDAREADAVAAHYLDVLAKVPQRMLDCQISVKLTQLGLDIDKEQCFRHLRALTAEARQKGNVVWVDMEQHPYVDPTLELYRRVRAEFPNVGVCLQAYLHRTAADLDALVSLGGAVRLVKGAYLEPASVAIPRKADVDANYLALAKRMLAADARAAGFQSVFGTHDPVLIDSIQHHAGATGVPSDAYEFDLLYGIQRGVQERLARTGYRIRVLVAYGDFWFPWYMRRLAERPANVWFVARSMFSN
jgi:proline dehydrogenase